MTDDERIKGELALATGNLETARGNLAWREREAAEDPTPWRVALAARERASVAYYSANIETFTAALNG